jgi:NodT family efflux transporter outer membrane factor (OMF) lipoprotein
VENRYRQGLGAALDVYQARQNLLEAREALPAIASSLAVAEHGLSVLVGRFPEENIGGQLMELAEAPEAFPAGLPATLLTSRPDIEAARLRLASKDAEVAAAVAARFPTLNLLGGYGVSRIDQGLAIASGTFWNLAAELSQSLFDAGARKAEVERRQAAFAEQLDAYRQAVLNAVREVEDALARNRATELQLQILKEREEAAAAALRLATGDYFEGLSDYLPVLVAQQLHFQTQRSILSSKRQLLSDRIGLARALGGSWPEITLTEQLSQAGEEKFPSNGQGDDNEQQ